jgi:hypothetical protein
LRGNNDPTAKIYIAPDDSFQNFDFGEKS